MRTSIAAFTVATVISILLPSCAWAAPTEVAVRVEGQSETFFEGPILTEGHDVASATGNTEEHPCDGTNNKAHATPGPTPTAAGADAMSIIGEPSFSGQWYTGYQDFLIKRWGPQAEGGEGVWHLVVNNVFTNIGGCQYELAAGDEALWVFKGEATEPLLALLPVADAYTSGLRPLTATARLNQPFEVEVLAYPDNAEDKPPAAPERTGSSPLKGAEVVPVKASAKGFESVEGSALATSGSAGKASITFTTAGWHRIRAISAQGEEAAVRSNRLDVCVPPEGLTGCGPLEPEDDVRAASRTPEELKREEEAKRAEEAKYAEEVKLSQEAIQREEEAQKTSTGATGKSEVLSFQTKAAEVPPVEGAPLRVQVPVLDSQGAARGLVGVSWRILEAGVGVRSWTIAAKALGSAGAGYVTRATGTSATSALLALPPGAAYDLQITFTDMLGRNSTTAIGKVLVPLDDRSSALRYRGRWRKLKQSGAWLDTVSRGGAGAQVTATLGVGRPIFMLRGAPGAAKVEVREGSHSQVITVAHISTSASRLVTGATRAHSGTVSLRVLQGTVDLDGVAVEG
jgi:hypothetical protein